MSLLARLGRNAAVGLLKHCQTGRGFAAEVTSAKGLDVQTHGVHGRYALAFFNAGAKSSALDALTKDLAQVTSLASTSKEFAQFLDDPSIPKRTKKDVLNSALSEMKANDVTKSFFGLLAENNRLNLVPKIAETFDELVSASRGEVTARITTAEEPEREVLEEIKSGLKSLLKPGQSLKTVSQVDPVIIGGLIIELGDKRVDLSILSRVKKIQQLLRETV